MDYLEVIGQTTRVQVLLTTGGRYGIGTCAVTGHPNIGRLIVFRSWSIVRRLDWVFAFSHGGCDRTLTRAHCCCNLLRTRCLRVLAVVCSIAATF